MLLADSGFYFHLSRLVDSPEKHQHTQVLFIGGPPATPVDPTVYLQALPKLLCLQNMVSYININEFASVLHVPMIPGYHQPNLQPFRLYFKDFLWDPVRSGGLHRDGPTWHAFSATRFLRFLATASSQ